jgi:hypothetical protein
MSLDLYEELVPLLDLFEDEGIDYALCGGIAVALHGYTRFTKDIDVLVPAHEVERIRRAVRRLGFKISTGAMPFGVGTEHRREVHRISKIEDGVVLSLDLVVVSSALQGVWEDREVFEWVGRKVKAVSAEGLALMKRLAGRDQDLLDLKMLGFTDADDQNEDR